MVASGGGGTASQVTVAMPTPEEWLEICEPGLRKATLGMFRAVKEIAHKIRTVTCDKMTCHSSNLVHSLQIFTSLNITLTLY
jgi:hypothetical protein